MIFQVYTPKRYLVMRRGTKQYLYLDGKFVDTVSMIIQTGTGIRSTL
jgi:hypothetical protein